MQATSTSSVLSPAAADAGGAALTGAEVRQLWWFLDGAIMDHGTRRALHESFGLCSRHAWALAIVECEARGGVVFATTVLYEDLARRAARLTARRRPRALLRRALTGSGQCFTCEFVAKAGYDGGWERELEAVNRGRRLRRLIPAQPPSPCPHCCSGAGLTCRPHLIAGAEPPRDLGRELSGLADRLGGLRRSLTAGGPAATAAEQVAWIEALGWFAGWSFWQALLSRWADARTG
jgi:hypothetical protein